MSTHRLRLPLQTTDEQHARLLALQTTFAEACNAVSSLVQSTKCWNRVALHHMAYKSLRERFPTLGSQMVCNAIYAVSRTSRLVYQSPGSPFNLSRLDGKPLPLMHFLPSSPVYFDRHTLSLKDNQLSMFTLDGRLKFQLALAPAQSALFQQRRLLELVLQRRADERFVLSFQFEPEAAAQADDDEQPLPSLFATRATRLPAHVQIAHR